MPSIIHSGNNNSPNIINQLLSAIQAAVYDIQMFYNNLIGGWSGTFTDGDGNIVTVTNGLVISVEAPPIPPTSFKMTWDDIGNALYTTVGDYNTLFGSDFTTLTVDGNDQLLTGNSTTFAMPSSAFEANVNLVAVDDTAESCTSLGAYAFVGCNALTTVSLPACTTLDESAFESCFDLTDVSLPACTSVSSFAFLNCTALTTISLTACTAVGNNAFSVCTSLTNLDLTLCEDLGGSTGDDSVFSGIGGQTITLTVAASRETCDGGNPDGDIVSLAANNTATINYV